MQQDKAIKALIGVGAIGLAAYVYMSQQTTDETIGGSGAFTGLGGGESLTEGGLEALTGTTDNGVSYNINLPEVDTSGLAALISSPTVASNGDVVTTTSEPSIVEKAATTKKAATTAKDSTKAETSGSLSASLAQVFGTESQKTNERGDYYTTAAGGGAGAVKGLSLGEMAVNLLTGKTAQGVSTPATLPTGASTAVQNINLPDSATLKKIADTKKAQDAAIAQTKIGAYTPVSNPLQALKDSGIVKQSYNPSSTPTTTTKKAATTTAGKTYKENGQTKYKDASGKVHVVAKKSK